MTPQEQQMLQGLTDRISQTDIRDKDPEAERYLQDTLGRNPDALYILAQTVIVQQYALDQLKKQLAEARTAAQVQQPQKHTSFLGNLLGLDNQPAPPPPPPQQGQYVPVPNYAPPPPQYGSPYPPAQYAAPQYGAPPQQGGFLRSALQTATGVAAGALAFEGIESLMHGFGGHSGGSNFGSFGDASRPEVINNYYGDSAEHPHEHGMSSDIEDRRNDPPYFSDNDSNKSDATDFAATGADNDDSPSDFGDLGDDSSSSGDDNSF